MNKAGSGLPRGIQKRGDKLSAYLTHPGGRRERRSLGNVSVSVAVKMLHRWQTEIADATYTPKKKVQTDAVTFAEISDDWIAMQRDEHPKSLESTESRLKLILSWFGSRKAPEITPAEIEANLKGAAKEKGWKDATYNNYRLVLSSIYRLAIEHGKVSLNPASKVKLKKLNNKRTEFLAYDEADALRAYIQKHYPDRVPDFDLALFTGMRHSEMYGRHEKRIRTSGLTWEYVKQSFVTIPDPKNGTKRHIPLNDTAAAALRVFKSRHKTSNRVMVNKDGSDCLGADQKWFEKSVKAVGLMRITWHSLRHTFASWLVQQGEPLLNVSRLMGHSSIKMTERYSHLAPDGLASAVKKLDKKNQPETRTATKTATVLPVTPQAYTN